MGSKPSSRGGSGKVAAAAEVLALEKQRELLQKSHEKLSREAFVSAVTALSLSCDRVDKKGRWAKLVATLDADVVVEADLLGRNGSGHRNVTFERAPEPPRSFFVVLKLLEEGIVRVRTLRVSPANGNTTDAPEATVTLDNDGLGWRFQRDAEAPGRPWVQADGPANAAVDVAPLSVARRASSKKETKGDGVAAWSAEEVADWLRKNLGAAANAFWPAFVAEGVTGALFVTLTDSDLQELGVSSSFRRKRLLHEIHLLCAAENAESNSATSGTKTMASESFLSRRPAPRPGKRRGPMYDMVMVMSAFAAEDDDEMSITAGERLELLEMDGEWWLGRRVGTKSNEFGAFPASHVVLLDPIQAAELKNKKKQQGGSNRELAARLQRRLEAFFRQHDPDRVSEAAKIADKNEDDDGERRVSARLVARYGVGLDEAAADDDGMLSEDFEGPDASGSGRRRAKVAPPPEVRRHAKGDGVRAALLRRGRRRRAARRSN